MSFYQPQFLWALIALAIPILVHLFYFRKVRRIYFSNLALIKQVKEAKKQQLKLKHYLILASRLLAIFFLVMVFAQPYQPNEDQSTLGEQVWVYLDNSPSMGTLTPNGYAGFDQGVAAMNSLIDVYPQGTQFRLLTNAFEASGQRTQSVGEVSEALTEMALGSRIRTLPEILNRLTSASLLAPTTPDVYLISDFQRSVFQQPTPIDIDSSWNLFLTPISYGTLNNVYVDSVFLETPFLQLGQDNALQVALSNKGQADREDLLLKLFVNGVQVGNASVTLNANASGDISFPINFPLEDINQCRISIEDYPVVFDNDFYFTLQLAGRIRVVEVKPAGITTAIEQVYGNTSLFNFSTFPETNVDYSALETADMVVLTELHELNTGLQGALTRYQQNGGTLVVIPNAKPNLPQYNTVLGLNLKSLSSSRQDLRGPNSNNPFFENMFTESSTQVNMPQATPVISWSNQREESLLSFKTGAPFLARERFGAGSLYLFASPINTEYNGLSLHAIFVPIMYKIAVRSKKSDQPLFYRLNSTNFTLEADSLSSDMLYKLVRDDQELIPNQRVSDSKLVMEVPQNLLTPGYYQVVTPANEQVATLAFNLDTRESALSSLDGDALAQQFSGTQVSILEQNSAEGFQQQIQDRDEGNSWWKYALWLTLLFLGVEIALVRWL